MPRKSAQKVVLLTHEFSPVVGGAGIYVEEVARAAAERGFDVTVWAPAYRDRPLSDDAGRAWPFRVKRIPMGGTQGWADRIALARTILRGPPPFRDAILHVAEPGPMAAMLYLQWFPLVIPKRLILTFHGSDILNFSKFPHRRWLMRKLIGRADRIAVLSRANRRLLEEHFPKVASKTVVTFAAPRRLCGEEPGAAECMPPPVDTDSEKVVLLTVGRIHPRKGQQLVVEALSRLAPSLRDKVEYWIAGPIIQRSYMRNLKGMIDRSGVTVRLFGSVGAEMLDSLYRQAHIFAMTSIRHSNSIEGYGLSYLEASAHGLPIVAFRTGGVEDAVRDGETGFLLEEGDMDALTRTFEQLVQDAALRKSIGERGVRFVRNLSWHTVVDRLYAKLI